MKQRIKKYHFTLQHYVGASFHSIYWKLCILDIQYLWFKPSIFFHNPQLYQFLKQCVEFCTLSTTIYDTSYNYLIGHSHRLVSNYKYTERPIGSSHYVRICHQISIVMLLVALIWYDNAQYSLFTQFLTPKHQFANRGTGTPNRDMSQTFNTLSNTYGKSLRTDVTTLFGKHFLYTE